MEKMQNSARDILASALNDKKSPLFLSKNIKSVYNSRLMGILLTGNHIELAWYAK